MPGTRCNILTCNNSRVVTKRQNIKISYHKFPKVKEVRDIWIERCKRSGKWNYGSCHICSVHFNENDYERDLQAELLGIYRRKVLKKDAVPTRNLPDFEGLNTQVLNFEESDFDIPERLYHLKMSPAISSRKDDDDSSSSYSSRSTTSSSDNPDSAIVDLDSEDDQPLQPSQPAPELKRIAKKSTVSQSYRQPPAAATRRQVALANSARKSIMQDKFLENFDPESSARERRKLNRKVSAVLSSGRRVPGAIYDEFGIHMATGTDLCDCLQKSCLGCHFPCPKCKSSKCGPECRSNRKYTYEQIEYHGCDLVIKNPLNK